MEKSLDYTKKIAAVRYGLIFFRFGSFDKRFDKFSDLTALTLRIKVKAARSARASKVTTLALRICRLRGNSFRER